MDTPAVPDYDSEYLAKIAEEALPVGRVAKIIQSLVRSDDRLQSLWVRGEVSNKSNVSRAGHLYFSLKDEEGDTIQCAWFGFGELSGERKPEFTDGDEVFAYGNVDIYPPRSTYQLKVRELIPAGKGLLLLEFEKLKEKLAEEGLFADEHKREIPGFPSVLGVVTSGRSAAFRDVIETVRRRAPWVKIVLFDCDVQGEEAAPTIISALKQAESVDAVDTVVLTRGGGSLEDLWCFNDEQLARELFALEKPVVTGVGHETDFTLVDFVADLRAPTPTAAAERATPDGAVIREQLGQIQARLPAVVTERLENLEREVQRSAESGVFRRIFDRLRRNRRELDRFERTLARKAERETRGRLRDVLKHFTRLTRYEVLGRFGRFEERIDEISGWLPAKLAGALEVREDRLDNLRNQLNALSPERTLERGYSMVLGEDDEVISRTADLELGQSVTLRMSDGEAGADITGVDGEIVQDDLFPEE